MVDHCLAEQLLEHFFKFIRKSNLDLHHMLYIGMNGPNVNLKFEELLRSSESFKHLNISVFSIFFFFFFLTAIWLTHGQIWAILKGTASLTRC